MDKEIRLAARVIALCPFVFLSLTAFADTLTGRVVKVADGDTITVLDNNIQHKIRLQGIDAPERKQPFGNASIAVKIKDIKKRV